MCRSCGCYVAEKARGIATNNHNLGVPDVALDPAKSILVVIDMQPSFMKAIYEIERVNERTLFMARLANLLEVPVLSTEQYPERMGATAESLRPYVGEPIPKMSFSC